MGFPILIIFRFYLLEYFFSSTLVLTSSVDVVFILSILFYLYWFRPWWRQICTKPSLITLPIDCKIGVFRTMYYGWSAVAGMRVCQLQLSLCRSKFRLKTDNETVVLLPHEINQHIQMLLNGKYVKKWFDHKSRKNHSSSVIKIMMLKTNCYKHINRYCSTEIHCEVSTYCHVCCCFESRTGLWVSVSLIGCILSLVWPGTICTDCIILVLGFEHHQTVCNCV